MSIIHFVGDTTRIVESLLHNPWNLVILFFNELLQTRWPIFHTFDKLYSTRPKPLAKIVNKNFEFRNFFTKETDILILISVNKNQLRFLRPFLFHVYNRLGILKYIRLVSSDETSLNYCESIGFEHLCLPMVSKNPVVSKYFYLLKSLVFYQNGVVWSNFDNLILKDPLPFLRKSVEKLGKSDIFFVEDFYAKNVRTSFFFVQNTTASFQFLTKLFDWIRAYPFANEHEGFNFLVYSNHSFLVYFRASYIEDPVENLRIGLLDSVGRFISNEGFYAGPVTYSRIGLLGTY